MQFMVPDCPENMLVVNSLSANDCANSVRSALQQYPWSEREPESLPVSLFLRYPVFMF